jgi:hypothetical protein
MLRILVAVGAMLLLTACSSLGGLAPSGGGSGGARPVDLVADDLANIVFALDLPQNVEPAEAGPSFAYDVNDKDAPPFLDTVLVRGDADAVMAALPAPEAGRSYHVYVLNDAAREKMRALQRFARTLPKAPMPIVNIVPRLCLAGAADKGRSSFAVRIVLPGRGALQPLIAAESLGALEARSAAIPACTGHSG